MNLELMAGLRDGEKVYFFESDGKPVLRTGKVLIVPASLPYCCVSHSDGDSILAIEKIFTDKESALASIEVKE